MYPQQFEVAVLGCAVNGPGEAGDADFGIAGGREVGLCLTRARLEEGLVRILIDELFFDDRQVDLGGHAASEATQDGRSRQTLGWPKRPLIGE